MNTNQQKRIDKIYVEEIYLLDIKKNDNEYIYSMSGSTANLYTIKVNTNTKTKIT